MAINKVDFGGRSLSGLNIDCNVSNTRIQVRRLSSGEFATQNPVLEAGEPGLETDTGKIKYGNGVSAWNSLPYSGGGGVTSVAGRTGDIVLGTSDISGFNSAAGAAAPVQSVAGRTGSVTLTSSDVSGIFPTYSNWTQRTLPTSANWVRVTYGKGIFVTVGQVSAIAATSPDGINWTQRTLPSNTNWFSLIYGNGTFATLANGALIAASSQDGVTWTQRSLPVTGSWFGSAYGGGTFLAVSYGSSVAVTSQDGITWTQRTLPANTNWSSVAYGNGNFVAVSFATTIAATSQDGITWTQRTLPVGANWNSIAYGNGIFVVVSNSNSSVAATSPDGITWTQRTLPASSNWNSVSYGNGLFVAISSGNPSVLATSADGITWTQRSIPANANWSSVVYGGGTFVAVANVSSIAATSTETLASASAIPEINLSSGVSTVAGRSGSVKIYASDISPEAGTLPTALLPKATSSTLGAVSVGSGLSVSNGELSANVAEIAAGKGISVSSAGNNRTIDANVAGITAGSGISVSSDANNNFTISSPGTQSTINRSITINGSAVNISAPFSSTTAQDFAYIFTGSAAGYALVLPTAVNNVCLYTLKNATDGIVYVNTSNSETIDNYAQPNPVIGLSTKYSSITLVSDGSNWVII